MITLSVILVIILMYLPFVFGICIGLLINKKRPPNRPREFRL